MGFVNNTNSITRYQFIELPRFDSDSDAGYVRLIFDDPFWGSIWDIKPETAFSGEKFWFDVEKLKIIDSWKQTIPIQCKACNKEVTEGFILVTPEENMKICSIDCYKAMKNAPVERIGF